MADYAHRTTTTTETRTTVAVGLARPELDMNYVKSLPGILKIIQIVLSILTFICSVAGCSYHSNAGWAAFVSCSAFVITIIFLIFHLLHIYEEYPRLPWHTFELIYYGLWTLFYLIAGACLAALAGNYWCRGSAGAGAFFAFTAMVVFGVDAFFKFQEWRSRNLATRTGGEPGIGP